MSKASLWVKDVLQEAFPDLYFGHYNCKKWPSGNYSQHSWPNAGDLTNKKYGYSIHPDNQAYLDRVYQYLKDNEDNLSIRLILWRVKDHFNHIHIDFWPEGVQYPPCAGGTLRYRYESGRIVNGDPGPANGMNETNDPRPTPPPDDEGDYIMPTLKLWAGYNSKGKGHLRVSVKALQVMLAHQGFADQMSADKTCAADGWFGHGTDEQVRAFQRSHTLEPDGICGRLTWSALNA